ncbi:MAG: DMT family transporter [Methylococcaceae bacterium]|nr:DMT family transporter [Methylococcaceae bacterium]
MRILFAYLSLILLWSTTPLAIQWSSNGVGFLFSATARMILGLICVSLILLPMRQPLAWHRKACFTYLAVATQLYASMVIVYWAAQFLPSSWVSVVFGLVPLMTAIIAALYLGERSLTIGKISSYALGLGGLILMFGSALQLGSAAVWAIASLLGAAFLQAASAVWVKQINAQLPALVQVAGGLLLAVPAYAITWWIWDGQWPVNITLKTLSAILYLGVLATTFGFALYYFILKHLAASRVALISLISPVLALLLGHYLNHEPLTLKIIQGVGLILGALILHEFADYRLRQAIA